MLSPEQIAQQIEDERAQQAATIDEDRAKIEANGEAWDAMRRERREAKHAARLAEREAPTDRQIDITEDAEIDLSTETESSDEQPE